MSSMGCASLNDHSSAVKQSPCCEARYIIVNKIDVDGANIIDVLKFLAHVSYSDDYKKSRPSQLVEKERHIQRHGYIEFIRVDPDSDAKPITMKAENVSLFTVIGVLSEITGLEPAILMDQLQQIRIHEHKPEGSIIPR